MQATRTGAARAIAHDARGWRLRPGRRFAAACCCGLIFCCEANEGRGAQIILRSLKAGGRTQVTPTGQEPKQGKAKPNKPKVNGTLLGKAGVQRNNKLWPA